MRDPALQTQKYSPAERVCTTTGGGVQITEISCRDGHHVAIRFRQPETERWAIYEQWCSGVLFTDDGKELARGLAGGLTEASRIAEGWLANLAA